MLHGLRLHEQITSESWVFSYADMEKRGHLLHPEKVTIKTWVEQYSRLKSVYCYEVYNENGELATTGSTQLICMKSSNFRPIRLDRYFPEWHKVYSHVDKLNQDGKDFEVTQSSDLEI